MKAFVIGLVCLVIAVAVWFTVSKDPNSSSSSSVASSTGSSGSGSTGKSNSASSDVSGTSGSETAPKVDYVTEDELAEDFDEDIKPATAIYNNAQDALTAIKKAAEDYDDLVLEQFSELGDNCTWCDELYSNVNQLMLSPDTDEDSKSYYAEVLAVSGRIDNISALVNAIKDASDSNSADLYAEALEVATGDDKLVNFLGDNLSSDNEVLREASVAAITNHGSRAAIDLLYNNTVERGDPDGYYSVGIGLGEVIPDEDSLPYLGELANKRDQYSHLAVKALLNYGDQGLKMVIDSLERNPNQEENQKLLEDAVDHISIEDNTEDILKQCASSSASAAAKDLCKSALEDYEIDVAE